MSEDFFQVSLKLHFYFIMNRIRETLITKNSKKKKINVNFEMRRKNIFLTQKTFWEIARKYFFIKKLFHYYYFSVKFKVEVRKQVHCHDAIMFFD
jgi:hypothetical protein